MLYRTLAATVVVLAATACADSPSARDKTYARQRAISACRWQPEWVDPEPAGVADGHIRFLAADPHTTGPDSAWVWQDRVVCIYGSGPDGHGGLVRTVNDGGKVPAP